ncbi:MULTISPECIES: gluconate 2-dehydrogenase subunit 3 family protein [Serratia]|uniref:gluconate 2-dehydrogenase subunit 3 family protein n=1 Tax=Serratia TaxID=613 RepID=UPI0014155B39|nr:MULTISPECIES: gluconate 2-dehydrogenase subunit 3 family protein [Serratia]NYA43289.1 gluconate 2-dehydrogenase subunit 3 family protein [Serratia fonticola]QIP94026.1 gluconate 2-dehydrogenase [Serratia fonticola]UAN53776.1 gluconate 2-dehydrogenase subunit 3 family protein [Serratia sp. JSRIV002]
MSRQHSPEPPRRNFLKKTLALIPLAAAGGTSVLMMTPSPASAAGVSSHYVPAYFNNEEWRFLLAACDRLIPSDSNGPGAVEEGVPIFIDKQMETPYGHGGLWYMHPPFVPSAPELGYQSKLTPRDTYRIGIRGLNAHCQQQYQKAFADLEHSQQEQILTALEKGELDSEALPGQAFFSQLLQNTKEGYLADPQHGGNQSMASWKLIGFPGARADYTDWVDHPNQAYPLGPVSISSKRNA